MILKIITKSFVLFCAFWVGLNAAVLIPQLHHSYLKDKVGHKVVRLLVESRQGGGTGFQIEWEDETYVMTNAHVCGQDEGIMWGQRDDQETEYVLTILKRDVAKDLCLLSGIPYLEGLKLNSEPLMASDEVHVFGHPFLNPLTHVWGIINYRDNVTFPMTGADAAQCSCNGGMPVDFWWMQGGCMMTFDAYSSSVPVHPGNSGSPVVDAWGNVRAVVFARGPGEGLLIPGDIVEEFLIEALSPCKLPGA